ncbi:cation:proton antiporter regulatory subunit [Candidatus Margulisiibacteriota bacterium]
MNLLLFTIILIISFIAVRIGAVAFELTGLETSLATFQALSCFTGTGFTTRESEVITSDQQRRRIASILMVLGNAGLVTLIATFANTLRPNTIMPRFTIPFLHVVFPPSLLPIVNLLAIILVVYIIFKIFNYTRFTRKLTEALRSHIIKKKIMKPVTFEELVVSTGGHGVSSIEIYKDSPIINKTLKEANLRKHDVTVLVIERKGKTIPHPQAEMKILVGDKLTCFGRLESIRRELVGAS